jgi:hypothetical protein
MVKTPDGQKLFEMYVMYFRKTEGGGVDAINLFQNMTQWLFTMSQ